MSAFPSTLISKIPIPAQAAAAGYNSLVFFDDFTNINTIDVNGTYAAGFNWYVHKAFPLAPETDWHSYGSIAANSFSVSGSVLTLNNTGNNWAAAIDTCVTNIAGNALMGRVFTGGFYVEARIRFDNSLQGNSGTYSGTVIRAWPSFWSYADNFLGGSSPNGPSVENDYLEAQPSDINPSQQFRGIISERTYSGGASTDTGSNPSQGFTSVSMDSNWHTFGSLALPLGRVGTDGNGYVRHYIDGSENSAIALTYTGSGTFSEYENLRFGVFLNQGNNWPMYVDYVAVWAKDSSVVVRL